MAHLVKNRGIEILHGDEYEAVDRFIADLGTYGVFVVPVGEVERWLSNLGVVGHASRWLVPMFDKLGGDPDHPDYVRPSTGDVWKFIRAIAAWIGNPHRRGVPS